MTAEPNLKAMKEKKSVKERKDIVAGYVAFSARLIAKADKDGKNYCFKDFLVKPVKLGEKN